MKKKILLTKDDLLERNKDKDISDINCYDFKESSLTVDEFIKAESIIFLNNNDCKILKDRHGIQRK